MLCLNTAHSIYPRRDYALKELVALIPAVPACFSGATFHVQTFKFFVFYTERAAYSYLRISLRSYMRKVRSTCIGTIHAVSVGKSTKGSQFATWDVG